MSRTTLAFMSLAACAAGCIATPSIEGGSRAHGEQNESPPPPLGAALTADAALGYGASFEVREGSLAGNFELAIRVLNVSPAQRNEDLAPEHSKIYFDDCADPSQPPGAALTDGCRQSSLASPWWHHEADLEGTEWQPSDGHPEKPAPHHTLVLSADLHAAGVDALGLLTQPLTAELAVIRPDERYANCRVTVFLEAFERLRFTSEETAATFDLDLHLRGAIDGQALVTLSLPASRGSEPIEFDSAYASMQRRVSLRPAPSTTALAALDLGAGLHGELSGLDGSPAAVSECSADCVVSATIEKAALSALFDSGAVEMRLVSGSGEGYRAALAPVVVPYDAQMRCEPVALPTSCVVGEAGVSCPEGVDASGATIASADSYCGLAACGTDLASYVCSEQGWEPTGHACDSTP